MDDDRDTDGGLPYRSPIRAFVFWCIMAILVWGIWAEGMVGGRTAIGLLIAAAVTGWWLIRTRPDNDEMTQRDVNRFMARHRDWND